MCIGVCVAVPVSLSRLFSVYTSINQYIIFSSGHTKLLILYVAEL